jgi:mannose-6-phosphate isomerase-like protein (cupin superfamily)
MATNYGGASSERRATLEEALALLPGPQGERFASVLKHGTLLVEIYAPRGSDPQKPHTRDEAYVVMQGNGEFLNGAERHPFQPGDVLFVPAHTEHRFVNFSQDLVVWVIFYGPEGGEATDEAREAVA